MSKGFAGGKGYGTRCPAGYCGNKGFRSSQGFGAGEAEEGLVYLPLRKTLDILSGGPEVFYKEGDATYSRPGLTTYIENGLLKEVAADVPVFEGGMFRSNGSISNLAKYNGDPAFWFGTGATVTDTGSYLAGSKIARLEAAETNDSVYMNFGNSVQFNENERYVFALVVKRISGSGIARIRLHRDQFSGLPSVLFDFDTKAVTTDDSPDDYGVIPLNDDRYLMWVSATTTAPFGVPGSLRSPYFWPTNNTVGDTYELSNWMIASGSFFSAYINTINSIVTCPKSDCQFPTPSALSGDSWEWSRIVKKRQEASDRYIMSCGNISLYVNDTNVTFAIGTDEVTVNGLLPDNVETEITIQKTPTQITLNGTSVPLTQIPSPGATVQIGADVNLLNQLNGYIKEVRISE